MSDIDASIHETIHQFIGRPVTPDVMREMAASLKALFPDRLVRVIVTEDGPMSANIHMEEEDIFGNAPSDFKGRLVRTSDDKVWLVWDADIPWGTELMLHLCSYDEKCVAGPIVAARDVAVLSGDQS